MTKRTGCDYEIGRNKPPVKNRWKPGQSGNPSGVAGRKKKASDSIGRDEQGIPQILAEELLEPVKVTIKGKAKEVPLQRALVKSMLAGIMNGTAKDKLNLIMKLVQIGVVDLQEVLRVQWDEPDDPFTEEDRRLIAIARSHVGL